MQAQRVLNINLGILGHVDSGKTSLSKALSSQGSTAAFDKNPQSQERGITIDLGFSVVRVNPYPERFKELPFDEFQFTIVDCPGHASFIRTVIGGAQIIDFMLLVIDATKGIQTQTSEGLVIGELTTDKLVVALNKVDMFPGGENDPEFQKMRQKVGAILGKTKFAGAPMVAVAANPKNGEAIGLDALLAQLVAAAPVPRRNDVDKEHFLFAVDHCFLVKGQGTVMTGTVLRGGVSVNDTVEIADLKSTKKVKSMQMFRKPVDRAAQGDRVGICVTQFESSTLERGLVCHPGLVKLASSVLVSCSKIRYYGHQVVTNTRFHISVGHRTTTAKVFFLKKSGDIKDDASTYEWVPELKAGAGEEVLCLLKFDSEVLCPPNAMYIASKLDADESTPGCRIAFHGKLQTFLEAGQSFEQTPIKVFKRKQKIGTIDRINSDTECIARGLFKSNFDMNKLNGFRLERECDGAVGEIRGSFGSIKNAKFKVFFAGGGLENMEAEGKSKRLIFRFKKFMGQHEKEWHQ